MSELITRLNRVKDFDDFVDEIGVLWCTPTDENNIYEERLAFLLKINELLRILDAEESNSIILELCRRCHGDDYEYYFPINGLNSITDKIIVECKIHGKFRMRLIDHLLHKSDYPQGCLHCLREFLDDADSYCTSIIISRLESAYGNTFDFRKSSYVLNRSCVDDIHKLSIPLDKKETSRLILSVDDV